MKPEEEILEPEVYSLAPYTGPWTSIEAAHLLRRTQFGLTLQQIEDAVTNGLDATITQLMTAPTFEEPLAYHSDETIANFGESWVNSVYPGTEAEIFKTINVRNASLGAWLMERVNREQPNIYEKMSLFWQNHFAAELTADPRATYAYFHLMRTQALGNFKQLMKDITIDPCMLVFLNGAENNKFSPNENFARELLELYTIGKGPQIGVGDYTNYTEADIAEGAKILTGWTIAGFLSSTATSTSAVYYPELHYTGDKTLSAKFGSQTVTEAGIDEYANYIDVIFQQAETARHICRKLYRWFVNYDLTDQVESTVIGEMATLMIANDYEVQPVVEALLKSQHFYDLSVRGAIIKSPLEYIFSILNSTGSAPNFDLDVNYQMYLEMYYVSEALGMGYLAPPSVGGWSAYYQAPNYSKSWVNSSYIKLRFDMASYVTLYGGINVNGNRFEVNHLGFLDSLSVPGDPNQVIADMVTLFCPKGLPQLQKDTLKAILLNGLPDFEWTLQYNEYQANPSDQATADAIKLRIALVLDQMFKLPEFQTI
ncbi:MAG: DUF1800 domain-containing protein [Bacteroidetes bacterium]|nr:MAG: DUF1800 domain-containing protein [Bacteroidota bacterium]